jgi:hypothetical protein
LSQALLVDLRLITPLALCFVEGAGIRGPVDVWLRIDRFDPEATLPPSEIRQLDPITARPGGSPEGDLP